LKNINIFVSGGAGVIGLEMVPKLVSCGANVMVCDLKPRPLSFPPNVIYRQGDLNYMTALELEDFAPSIIIHLAATFERSEESYEFWEENFLHNVSLSHHLMTIAKDQVSLKKFVFASSYLIYEPSLYQFDSAPSLPVSLNESDPVLPRNLTGMAKLAHEIELRFIDLYRSNKFTTVCARIYRGYGRNSRDIISRWVRSALNGDSITVFRPEGVFDYIYAKDSAEGLIRLAFSDAVSGVINLGTGRSRKVQDVLDILIDHFPMLEIKTVESSIPYEASQADMSLYKKVVGWMPKYDLETSIPEIIAHEKLKIRESSVVDNPLKVLVSSAAKKIPLIQAMKVASRKVSAEAKVVAGDISNNALSQYVADQFWMMPKTNDANVQEILQGCIDRDINMVLPTRDGELVFWAKHRSIFEAEGVHIIIAPLESIQLCVDKLKFSEFGVNNELPFIPSSLEIERIVSDRYVVKERFGAGSKSIGINLSYEEAINHSKALSEPIFQPFQSGIEISVDAWLSAESVVKGVVLRKRVLVENGESQITRTFRDKNYEEQIVKSLEVLKLTGPVVLQLIITEDNIIKIIECNARFGGASTTGIAVGLDVFYWSLLEAMGSSMQDYLFYRATGDVKQIRIASDIYVKSNDTNI